MTGLSIVLGALAAYAITRLRFTGRPSLARGLIFTYLLPGTLLFIPLFTIVARLDLVERSMALMLVYPTFTLPFCTWMMTSYFRCIPVELEEAGADRRLRPPGRALPDRAAALGAGDRGGGALRLHPIVERVPLRLRLHQLAAIRTVTVGLTQMLGEDVFFWGQMMAGALIIAVPPVILYMFAQRLVISGLAAGGVKG